MTKSVGPWGIVHSVSRRSRRRSWAASPLGGAVIAAGFAGGSWTAPFNPVIGGALLAVSAVVSILVAIDTFSR